MLYYNSEFSQLIQVKGCIVYLGMWRHSIFPAVLIFISTCKDQKLKKLQTPNRRNDVLQLSSSVFFSIK